MPVYERWQTREAAIGLDDYPLVELPGPPELVPLGLAEKVVEVESLVDRRAYRLGAQRQARREARVALVEGRLDQEAAATEDAAVVARNGHPIELEKVQSQPTSASRGPGEVGEQRQRPRVAADGRAGASLPTRSLQREEPIEITLQLRSAPRRPKDEAALAPQAVVRVSNLGPQVAAQHREQLVPAPRQRQVRTRPVGPDRNSVSGRAQNLGCQRDTGAGGGQSGQSEPGSAELCDPPPDELTGGVVHRNGVPALAVLIGRGGQKSAGRGAEASRATQPTIRIHHRHGHPLRLGECLRPRAKPLVAKEGAGRSHRELVPSALHGCKFVERAVNEERAIQAPIGLVLKLQAWPVVS